MQPLSNDLRKRILEAVDNKEGSRRKLASRFKVNTATITIDRQESNVSGIGSSEAWNKLRRND
jgi:hypothetical protein